MNEQMITKWFNFYGLIFMILILLPNIVFAATHKDGFENLYRNKFVEVAEQIGRFGCFICMFVSIPLPIGGFWFDGARLVLHNLRKLNFGGIRYRLDSLLENEFGVQIALFIDCAFLALCGMRRFYA